MTQTTIIEYNGKDYSVTYTVDSWRDAYDAPLRHSCSIEYITDEV